MTSVCIILSELSLSAGHRTSRHRATARRQHLPHRPFYTIQKRQTDQVSLVFVLHVVLLKMKGSRLAVSHVSLMMSLTAGHVEEFKRVITAVCLYLTMINRFGDAPDLSLFSVLREQKDPVYLREKVTQKHSREQFESAQRIEQDYSKYFTGLTHTTHNTHSCRTTLQDSLLCGLCCRCGSGREFVLNVRSHQDCCGPGTEQSSLGS